MMTSRWIGLVVLAAAVLSASCVKRESGSAAANGSADEPLKPIEVTTSSGVEMVLIPGGSFMMGSDHGDPDEGPPHQVTVSPFAIDKYEVTQAQFAALQLPDPSQFKDQSGRRPVDQIRWSDAAQYCNERSRREGLEPCYDEDDLDFRCNFEASGYRLPTEAEWEYAARAGAETDYDFGRSPRTLKNYACYAGNSAKKTEPVGSRKPNRWGLYDIYGNVWEWCHDRYSETYYRGSPLSDPRGPAEGKKRVLRGGAWNSSEQSCRVTIRLADVPGYADACFARNTYGFRCVRRLAPDELWQLEAAAVSEE